MHRGADKVQQDRRSQHSAAGCFVALAASLLMAQVAVAQQAAPQPLPQEQAAPPAPAPIPLKPAPKGLFEAIGRWFDEGTSGFRSHVAGAQTSLDDLNQRAEETRKNIGDTAATMGRNAVGASVTAADATRDAMGAVAKLPMSRIVQGRERCNTAPNGAPDCLAAAETLCRKQGFSTGKSIDFTSAESCPVKAWLGDKQSDGECRTVTFISKAMCQQ
jgi:hypothetical protein